MKIPYVTEFLKKRRTIDALEELLEHNNEENRAEAKRFRTRLADQRDAFEKLRKKNTELCDENEMLRAIAGEVLQVLEIARMDVRNALNQNKVTK